ncbi:MAG: alpha/beta fold hydrolase [Planctomycetes bacterium]|nr:alpha/beta fold hydrolase [Planctomycetota bacterium]
MVTFEYPFAPHWLDLDGLRYHYVDAGERDGEPVVLVHGNPTWSYLYRNLIPALGTGFRAIAPDHIGCGRSDKPGLDAYDYTLARRVADLGRLIDHLALDAVHLVVHDWGGMIGTAWATQNPERVRSMVVLNSGAFGKPTDKRVPWPIRLARAPMLGALLVRGLDLFCRGTVQRCTVRPLRREVAAGFREPYASWAERVAVHQFVRDIPLQQGDRSFAVMAQTERDLPRLRSVPKLLCWGMQDFVFDHTFLDSWLARFPDAEVHRFADAGHLVLEDAGPEVFALVNAFLRRVPAVSRAAR